MNDIFISHHRTPGLVSAPLTSGAGDVSDVLKRLLDRDSKAQPLTSPVIVTPGQKLVRASSGATSSGFLVNAPIHSWGDVGASIPSKSRPLPEQLFDVLASFKVLTSHISMHLGRDRRDALFAQLDELLDANYWDPEDAPTSVGSFKTFLRVLLLINPDVPPGLGVAANGNIVAAWYAEKDRLTLVCNPDDRINFVLSAETDGLMETASSETTVLRLPQTLAPYRPDRWFRHG